MLKSLSISKKLGGAFACVLLAALATMAFVFVTSRHVGELTEANERVDKEQALSAEVENSLLRSVANLRGYQVSRSDADAAAYQDSIGQFDKAAAELEPMLQDPKDLSLLHKTVDAAAAWRKSTAEPVIGHLSSDEIARVDALMRSGQSSHGMRDLVAGAEALRAEKHADVERALREMDLASQEEDWAVLVGAVLMAVIAAGMWAALRSLLGKPVVSLTGVMKTLAGGSHRIDVPDTVRGDELGDMARAVLVFRDSAIAKAEADRAKAVADAEQKLVVDTLAEGLGKLSQGDLTAEIGTSFPTSYASVKASFNEALTSLRELIGTVMESAETIRAGSREIAEASEHLATRTQSNAANLEETTAAIAQMDNRLQASAHAASMTSSRADEAIVTVRDGRAVTDEAVQAMGRVSDSAQGIDDVIEGLDKIAFQTRVLAMNAAVEAGRAGEAGRGFAVVADLVSALAMRAEEEAKRAREQLSVTQSDIVTAVDAVRKVDGALEGISSGVAEVHALVGNMAADNQAQAAAVREISCSVTAMDQATQQNAAMVEESSAAARTLTNEVHALAEQASRFRVGRDPRRPRQAAHFHTGALASVH